MQKIAVLSHVVLDEIHRPAREAPDTQIGGAGAYAALGASLAAGAGESLIVSGVGRADRPMIESWADSRGIDPRGLFDVGERSPRTRIDYFPNGERVETPVFGMAHFDAHTPLPQHVPGSVAHLAGTYLFHAHDDRYWDEVARWRPAVATPVLWEISRDSCRPRHLARVQELGGLVEVLSINLAEASALVEREIGELPHALAGLAPVVLLRAGDRGSLVIQGSTRIEVPAPPVDAIDPTGGGNSYSGAFLAAYASTGDLEWSARAAAATAAVVVSTAGTPTVDDDARAAITAAAHTITTRRKVST